VTGNTVRNAFQIGVTSIMAASESAQDQKKFLLLPEDGNHDVPIFADTAPGKASWHEIVRRSISLRRYAGPNPSGELVDETPREIKNTANKPPVFFLGRNAKVQEVGPKESWKWPTDSPSPTCFVGHGRL
jgi:hypothetical protein